MENKIKGVVYNAVTENAESTRATHIVNVEWTRWRETPRKRIPRCRPQPISTSPAAFRSRVGPDVKLQDRHQSSHKSCNRQYLNPPNRVLALQLRYVNSQSSKCSDKMSRRAYIRFSRGLKMSPLVLQYIQQNIPLNTLKKADLK